MQSRLRSFWAAQGVIPASASWTPLSGGRTNPVWKVEPPAAPTLVCKLFNDNGGTPLFANDPAAEALALQSLAGTRLAPKLVAAQDTGRGVSLVYSWVEGAPWRSGAGDVAALLARLHACPAPSGLPVAGQGAARLHQQGRQMLDRLGPVADRLRDLTPPLPDLPDRTPVFLHGDAVPGNILSGPGGLTLIDWQCPAAGDPCDDLAVFLSPAMQAVSGNAPLSPDDIGRTLNAYGDGRVTDRYRRLAPVYHWRMAAYCLWKAERGDQDYAAAAELEIACLQQ